MRHLKIERGTDGIATLVLDNADGAVNIVNDAFITEMEEAISLLADDIGVTGVILTSAKKAFMAGADLHQLVRAFESLGLEQAFAFSQRATRMHRGIEQSGKPWVAAIDGLALGGGAELALACHHRIMTDTARTKIGFPEVNVGLLPGSGGTIRLAIIAGMGPALDLLLTGRQVGASEALALGVADELAPPVELIARARNWLAAGPSAEKPWDRKAWVPPQKTGMMRPEDSAAYMLATGSVAGKGYTLPAPIAILSTVFEGLQLPFDKALAVEGKYFARLLTDPVARNIIRTTFISRQAAEKGARRPVDVPRSRVGKIGVLGAGMMGAGIAYESARAGITVVLLDRDGETAENGKAYTTRVQARLTARGALSQADADAVLGRITATADYALLQGCDLVVEAVFEDVGIKADTTRKAEAVIPDSAIFASNTSTLPITRLAEASARPDHFIGLHFFSPVDRMPLVEVITGERTSPETIARSLDYVAQLRKVPIVVNDSRGFYTSRVFQTLIHEGAIMLAEGIPPAVIENAATAVGLPVGPLALLDETSIGLPLKIVDEAIAEEGDAFTPPVGTPVMRRMADQIGRTGRKGGGGFYDYPDGAPKTLWRGLADHFPSTADYDVEEVKLRYLYVQAMESARCLEEGVIETAEDGDLGAIYGWSFPAWTGGTLSYIDTVGLRTFVETADRLAQRHGSRFLPSPWLRGRAERNEAFYPASA